MTRLLLVFALAASCATTPSALPPEPEQPAPAMRPALLGSVAAPFPKKALKNETQGTVVLIVWISDKGYVERVEVKEGPGDGLNEAAAEALKQYRFAPARDEAGNAIPYRFEYKYTFILD